MNQQPNRKRIITIAGRPGSGKSTTAKETAKRLGFRHFSSGDLFRQLGKERGVDVLEANKKAGVVEELDELVDSKLRELGTEDNELVIDSRTAWHWIPLSYKVFLDLDLRTAAVRILGEMSEARMASEHIHDDPDQYAKMLAHRLEVETSRYRALYGIDPYDMSNYDLVIDTAKCSKEEAIDRVVSGFECWIKSN